MKTLPADAVAYRRTPEFSTTTVPAALTRSHTTKSGVWGRISVVRGELRYRIHAAAPQEYVLSPDHPGIIEPEVPHEVEPIGDVIFFVEFLRRPA